MSIDAQIDFRSTSGYVTDGAGRTYCLGDLYPTIRGGLTFGWDTAPGVADRWNGGDVRIAGINYNSTVGTTQKFRLDGLTAGAVDVHLAIGDANFTSNNTIKILDSDGSTVLATITTGAITGGDFFDAAGNHLTYITWPTSEAARTVTITGTSLYIATTPPASTASAVAHFRAVQSGGGGGGSIVPKVVHHRKMMMGGL